MAKKVTQTQEYKEFLTLCKQIRNSTQISKETESEKNTRIQHLLSDYNSFCRYYFPEFANINCAKFHVEACRYIRW